MDQWKETYIYKVDWIQHRNVQKRIGEATRARLVLVCSFAAGKGNGKMINWTVRNA